MLQPSFELVLKLPEGEDLNFKAGGYIQIDIPEYHNLAYKNFDIENITTLIGINTRYRL